MIELISSLAQEAGYDLNRLRDVKNFDLNLIGFGKRIYFIQQKPIDINLGMRSRFGVLGPYYEETQDIAQYIAKNINSLMKNKAEIRKQYKTRIKSLREMIFDGSEKFGIGSLGERRFLIGASSLHHVLGLRYDVDVKQVMRERGFDEKQMQLISEILTKRGFLPVQVEQSAFVN